MTGGELERFRVSVRNSVILTQISKGIESTGLMSGLSTNVRIYTLEIIYLVKKSIEADYRDYSMKCSTRSSS